MLSPDSIHKYFVTFHLFVRPNISNDAQITIELNCSCVFPPEAVFLLHFAQNESDISTKYNCNLYVFPLNDGKWTSLNSRKYLRDGQNYENSVCLRVVDVKSGFFSLLDYISRSIIARHFHSN